MTKRVRSRKAAGLPTITLIPFIDVMLVLVIVFMLTNAGTPKGTAVLPGKTDKKLQVVHVYVPQANALQIDGTRVEMAQFKKHVQKALARSPIKTVMLEVEPSASPSLMHRIVDTIRSIEGAHLVIK